MIINKLFREDAENILTLKKEVFTALNREDRECEEKEPYSWTTCLHELFTIYKGCQEPWNINPGVKLDICSNLTQILGFYNEGPGNRSWDHDGWDRIFMPDTQLARIKRAGIQCKVPCRQVNYLAEISHVDRAKLYFKAVNLSFKAVSFLGFLGLSMDQTPSILSK